MYHDELLGQPTAGPALVRDALFISESLGTTVRSSTATAPELTAARAATIETPARPAATVPPPPADTTYRATGNMYQDWKPWLAGALIFYLIFFAKGVETRA
jgi:hypothetical protein